MAPKRKQSALPFKRFVRHGAEASMVEILPAAPSKADFFCDLCQKVLKNQAGVTAHQRFDEKHKEKAEQRENT